jgi:hypothetical protein
VQTLLSETRRIDSLPNWINVIETGDSRAVVSILEKGERQFLVIVNTSIKNSMRLTTLSPFELTKRFQPLIRIYNQ